MEYHESTVLERRQVKFSFSNQNHRLHAFHSLSFATEWGCVQ